MANTPSVLFVCVKNGGKSQMAAGLMRAAAGDRVEVHSAGTVPGTSINVQSAQSLREVGIDITDEHPKPIDRDLLSRMDLVITLGREATIDNPPTAVIVENWDTDEPSRRGIEGTDRMRLILWLQLAGTDPPARRHHRNQALHAAPADSLLLTPIESPNLQMAVTSRPPPPHSVSRGVGTRIGRRDHQFPQQLSTTGLQT